MPGRLSVSRHDRSTTASADQYRKMDILSADMLLKNQQKWKARGNQELDESEAGFHFIAFVKAKERVWKFDGLERQPQSLGMSSGTSPIQKLHVSCLATIVI